MNTKDKNKTALLDKLLEHIAFETERLGDAPVDIDEDIKPAPPPPRADDPKPPPTPTYDGQLHPEAWKRVVLAPGTQHEILCALHQYTHGKQLFDDWGLGEVVRRGRGVGILMYGPPGCGKTETANTIAAYLGTKLHRKDVAEIESCVPGQAERNLKGAFARALQEHAVLFFDECDSLINSRNASHMMEWKVGIINALLTELENYTGIVILATNRLDALDPAVNRRVACKVEIPRPDESTRREIWKVHIPDKLPTKVSKGEWKRIASLPLSGGEIKNAVLAAARMASMEGEKQVSFKHFGIAAKQQIRSRDDFNQKKNYLIA